MILKIITNDIVKVNNNIQFDNIENTMSIESITDTKVQGTIEFTTTSIIYNLEVNAMITFTNEYEYNRKNAHLTFNIDEAEEINEENPHIIEKTLDLNSKIWENIIVEIFTLSYSSDEVNNEDEVMDDVEVINPVVDERLAPLLQLLNSNEEV